MPAPFRAVFAFALSLFLMACQDDTAEVPDVVDGGEFGEVLLANREAQCVREGGRWGVAGRAGTFACYTALPDAGRACTTGRDCQGLCLARSRTCTPVQPLFGCHEIITETGLRSTLCQE